MHICEYQHICASALFPILKKANFTFPQIGSPRKPMNSEQIEQKVYLFLIYNIAGFSDH